MRQSSLPFLALAPALLGLVLDGCASAPPLTAAPAPVASQPTPSLAVDVTDELDTAMRIASSPPERVHAKVRSRLQREVAVTALQLGLTDAALRHAGRIDDWRRLEVQALAAQSLASAGQPAAAMACLERALAGEPNVTDWMRERLDTEIAIAFARLGQAERARSFASKVPPELAGAIETALVPQSAPTALEGQLDAFDRAIATGSLDVVRSGIDGHLAAWRKAGDDAARASRSREAVRKAAAHLPIDLRIRTRLAVASVLLAQGRAPEALRELEEARQAFIASGLEPELAASLARDLAVALHDAGRGEEATRMLMDMLRRYEVDAPRLADIDRADALRPIAEGLQRAGQPEEALRAWAMALQAGSLNPNARPRAEDLCLTWLSMARCGVRPPEPMRQHLRRIEAELKAPW